MTGDQFKAIRIRLGMSVPELAKHLGFDRSHVYSLENGNREITRVLELLMKAYAAHPSLTLVKAPQRVS